MSVHGTVARLHAAHPVAEHADMDGVVVLSSAVAGVGVSTLAAMLARTLTQRGVKCVLVDADLQGGGLDVLLGIENEDGSRFGDINAPLGNVDGKALLRELPVWMVCRYFPAIHGRSKIRNGGRSKPAFVHSHRHAGR